MPRKIIQIAVSVLPWHGETDFGSPTEKFEETLYALADDGTVWYSVGSSPTIHRGWCRDPLPALPQGEAVPYTVPE